MAQLEEIKPYKEDGTKREQVERMFNHLARNYDLLNHLLSLGIDRRWRRIAIDTLGKHRPQHVLDIATGTGDFAILNAKRNRPQQIVGADISDGMMAVGKEKVEREGLQDVIRFQHEDCTNLSFSADTFDAVTAAYGVRNFENLRAGIEEMYRVLKPGGHLLIVELSVPPHFPMKQLFSIYAHVVMPTIGWLVSRDKSAYTYLPQSMEAFPQAEVMEPLLSSIGFRNITWKRFTFGLSTMYIAQK